MGSTLEIHMTGYIDVEGARAYQLDVESALLQMKRVSKISTHQWLLLYVDDLSGFEAGRVARQHGEWFAKMRPHLSRIAIVSQKTSVTLAISIAKLLSKTPLQQFTELSAAPLLARGLSEAAV